MTKITSNNHFVPKLLIKNFVGIDGKIYLFNKNDPTKGIKKRSPEKLFVRRHLYTSYDNQGNPVDDLERYYANEVENGCKEIFDKIIDSARKNTLPNLTKDQRNKLSLFIFYQFKRVPERVKSESYEENYKQTLIEMLEEAKSYFNISAAKENELKKRFSSLKEKQNITTNMLKMSSKEVLTIINNKNLGMVKIITPKKSFVLGSNPLLKCSMPGRSHLGYPEVELWLPISHDVAITPYLMPEKEKLVLLKDVVQIREINEGIYQQSDMVASNSPKLLKSLSGENINTD